ncbi:MAG: tRNA (adenosine(37)-N6)-dimethylallyltransferase MiaA [Fidelibacterota bacterium]
MTEKITSDTWKICPTIPIITGPTAVGKTSASIELAKMIDGEIVSIDSRQLYKFLDIGTAKPTLREQKEIPHHLIDLFEPTKQVSAGEYRRLAVQTVEGIVNRGKTPIFVGGSGMYIKAITHGIFKESTSHRKVRKELQSEIEEKGNVPLYNRLMEIDPETAKKIHINDAKRITRALEIYKITGKPPSEHYKAQQPDPAFPTQLFVLHRDRAKTYARINQRVEQMISEGLIEETKDLLNNRYRDAMNELKTLGYQEVIQYLDGEVNLAEMTENLKMNTRRYAKRQLTWSRHQLDAQWIEISDQDTAIDIAKKIKISLEK